MFDEDIEYTANYFHQHMSGGSLAEMRAAINDLVKCCKDGNFKAGVVLNCFRILGIYPIVDKILKITINTIINNIARRSIGIKIALDRLLKSLHNFKLEDPAKWKQLVLITKQTKQFNDTAIRAMIFMVVQCPGAIREVLKAFMDLNLIYNEIIRHIIGPPKWGINLLFKLLCKKLKFRNREDLFAKCNEYIHATIDKVMKEFEAASNAVGGVIEKALEMSISAIKKAVNSADPFGIVFPIATYLCYDIIVARVEAGKLKLPLHPLLKLVILIIIITSVVKIVNKVKEFQANQLMTQEAFSIDINQGNKLIGNLGKKLSIIDNKVEIT